MKTVSSTAPIIIDGESVDKLRGLIDQIRVTENPVTTSSLKHILAKQVGRILGYEDRQLDF